MLSQGTGGRPERAALLTAAALLVVGLLFGGGSRGAGDLVVHLLALPALAFGILRWHHAGATALQRSFLYVMGVGAGLMALQLLPVPMELVGHLPERTDIQQDLEVAGASSAWVPMSLDRWGTARALLALTTFVAMWLIASTLPLTAYRKLLQLAALIAVPLAILGFAQVGGVGAGSLVFHKFQNTGVATAFFANRNHFATLLAMLAPLAFLFGYLAQQQRDTAKMSLWYFALALMLLGAAMTFSRTGVLLATISTSIVGAMVLQVGVRSADPRLSLVRGHLGLVVALIGAGLAVANYAWSRIIDRFQQDPLGDRRWEYLEYGWAATKAHMPWGAGFGSFRDVYASFEPVTSTVNQYALHAHNDVLELALEAGGPVIFVLLVALSLVGVGVWQCIARDKAELLGKTLAISTLVPLVHSLGDYPFRTLAITNLFALLVAGVLRPWSAKCLFAGRAKSTHAATSGEVSQTNH